MPSGERAIVTLIQNVSENGIPNAAAIKTFKPDRIIWICPEEDKRLLEPQRAQANKATTDQQVWYITPSDPQALSKQLRNRFESVQENTEKYIFHLSSGPKSLTIQGLAHFISRSRNLKCDYEALIWDEPNCCFDVVYPTNKNDAYTSALLSLDEMLATHGNHIDQNRPLRSLNSCKEKFQSLERLRILSQDIKRDMAGKTLKGSHASKSKFKRYELVSRKGGGSVGELPKSLLESFELVSELELINQLKFHDNALSFNQLTSIDAYGYVNGGWLEDWVGAVLSGIKWQQAGIGVQMLAGSKLASKSTDSQEFDFLGAYNNRLVYLSCKHTADLSADELFEVDALRDDICGGGNHVVGVIHAGKIGQGMLSKARRLGIHVVDAMGKQALKRLIELVSS